MCNVVINFSYLQSWTNVSLDDVMYCAKCMYELSIRILMISCLPEFTFILFILFKLLTVFTVLFVNLLLNCHRS